ncbi:DUF4440 domain-containing protein [Mycobacterium intermedium]|uniref:DUF4440 domain-containing protein n=1 Tax=Mycobacterium intermedium TaxID=28445 RepID=A0A1E3SFM0_MYCIE|nr:nuclear transport factor 2 family protein [Mycobacterium intermedium]MCV6966174.1 nuclear transport factor 2 family protein [Mycobacterium intermedium]ODR00939.1 DUF4440 domain-containing protein [Mycobacterium intermedium]OPE48761.1 DUF4440 domain-containing protein [Mycobacterium intermedium]ORB09830.1 DUF4440 domain-containing protein [Mycobacterium intermedium]
MPAGDDASKAQILDVADRLFAAIEKTDIATVERMWSDDILVWRPGARRDDDKRRALRVIEWFISVTTERRYEILDRQVFDNGPTGTGRGFVQQHVLHATGTAGQTIALRVCIVIKLDIDGFINRIDEYFDPADIAVLLT